VYSVLANPSTSARVIGRIVSTRVAVIICFAFRLLTA
jgi:hypothetical protein